MANLKGLFKNLSEDSFDDITRLLYGYGYDDTVRGPNRGVFKNLLQNAFDVPLDRSPQSVDKLVSLADKYNDYISFDDYSTLLSGTAPQIYDDVIAHKGNKKLSDWVVKNTPDDEWLTNVLVGNRTLNKFNSNIPNAADNPLSEFYVKQLDLYQDPLHNGAKNLYWDSDYKTFENDLIADYAAFEPRNLHDPYTGVEDLSFEDGLDGLLNSTKAQDWADSVLASDSISNADYETAKILSRKNQDYIDNVFRRFGSDAVETYSLPNNVNMNSASDLQNALRTLMYYKPRRK